MRQHQRLTVEASLALGGDFTHEQRSELATDGHAVGIQATDGVLIEGKPSTRRTVTCSAPFLNG